MKNKVDPSSEIIDNIDEYCSAKAVDENREITVSTWGRRHEQCLLLLFSLTIGYSIRAGMGVSLVAMTDVPKPELSNLTMNNTRGALTALMLVPPYASFDWNKKIQDTILSSFFWGYMTLQIPAGIMAHKFGARYLLVGAMTINSVVSICLPWAALYGGWICTVICRILLGLSQACLLPGTYTILGKWVPLEERGRLTAVTFGGTSLGPVIGMPLTGFIAASPLGWPGVFRVYGLLAGLVAGLLWWKLADTPALDSTISVAERKYIEDLLGTTKTTKHVKVPWKKILKTPGLYAMIVGHVAQTWGQLTLYTEVPAFMDKIMGVNIKANGMLSALPFLVMWALNFFYSWLTDMLIVKKILSVTWTRKLAQTIATVPVGIGLIALAYVPKNIYIVETLLVVICAFKIATHAGMHVNHVDMAPNFAGTLLSITNFVSNLCGSLAPLTAGFILTDPTSEYLWGQVFFVSAGLYIASDIVYVAFGSAEKAEWNDSPDEDDCLEKVETVPMIEKIFKGEKK